MPLPTLEHIHLHHDGDLLVATLSRGKANAINGALMDELLRTVQEASAVDVRGLVLASDRPRFFSSGFDIREVFSYTPDQMNSFFRRFVAVYTGLRGLPKPVVAALSGHTFAGGSILALACDIRVMARGEFGFALSEINLGLVLTDEIRAMLTEAVGVGRARELLLSGEPVTPDRAYEIGLVHELAEADEVRAKAILRAKALAAKPPVAFAAMKQSLRGAPDSDPAEIDGFIEMWFSDEARQARRAVSEKMGL